MEKLKIIASNLTVYKKTAGFEVWICVSLQETAITVLPWQCLAILHD